MTWKPRIFWPTSSALVLACAIVAPIPIFADAGHDHNETATSALTPPSPRFETASDAYEVVGRVEGDDLRLWVDNWATNIPVERANLEITLGQRKVVASPRPDGSYEVSFPEHDTPGTYPITVSIGGVGAPALLGGKLVIGPSTLTGSATKLPLNAVFGGGALVLIVAGGTLWFVRRRRSAVASVGLALLVSGLAMATGTPNAVVASPGHDDDDATSSASAVTSDQAARLADGSILAPKPMQRLIGLRTVVSVMTDASSTVTLPGTIIADPNGSGVVQPQIGGRISGTLPALGQSVTRGEGLAVVTPGVDGATIAARQEAQGQATQEAAVARAVASSGTTDLDSELASARVRASRAGTGEAQAALDTAHARIARLRRLEGVVPKRDLDEALAQAGAAQARINAQRGEAIAQVRALEAQRSAIVATQQAQARAAGARVSSIGPVVVRSETLRAPVSGIISAVNVSQGQVVAPGQTLFTLIDPSRLLVEARIANAGTGVGATDTMASARTVDGRTLSLRRLGTGPVLIDGSAPIRFAIDVPQGLRAGEVVSVFTASSPPLSGVVIPREAISRSSNGQTVVFVKNSAENYVSMPVTVADLDAKNVLVTAGLSPGVRVVTTGASLLAQVR